MADTGAESHVEYPIDKDSRTVSLERLFRDAFFDGDGNSLLVDAQGQPITNPTVASLGPGVFAAHEKAALGNLFGESTTYIGAEPSAGMNALSEAVHEDEGGPGEFDLQDMTAEQLLEKIGVDTSGMTEDDMAKITERLHGIPLNILMTRNPLGTGGLLSSDRGIDEMAKLAQQVLPGGMVMVSYTHYDDSPNFGKDGGAEGMRVALLRDKLTAQGFETKRFGKRDVGDTSKTGLVYSDNGLLAMQRPRQVAPAPAPAGRPV